jgi:hypothetical protein
VSVVCRGLCVRLITRPEESYRVGVSECDREASIMRRPRPTRGCCDMGGGKFMYNFTCVFVYTSREIRTY